MSPREWIHDGDYGPFIGVMVFIVALLAASVLFTQCCVGDQGFMRTGYDFEAYVMRKCAVCVGTGLPKRTHPHVKEEGALEVEVVVEEVQASEPPAAAPAPPPPPAAAAAPAPPLPAAAAAVAVVGAAAKEEEEDEDKDWEDDGDDEEFNFDEEDDVLDL